MSLCERCIHRPPRTPRRCHEPQNVSSSIHCSVVPATVGQMKRLMLGLLLAMVFAAVSFFLFGTSNNPSMACDRVALAEGADTYSTWFEIGTWPPHWICKTNRGTHNMGILPSP